MEFFDFRDFGVYLQRKEAKILFSKGFSSQLPPYSAQP
jgi:hypothetical protein